VSGRGTELRNGSFSISASDSDAFDSEVALTIDDMRIVSSGTIPLPSGSLVRDSDLGGPNGVRLQSDSVVENSRMSGFRDPGLTVLGDNNIVIGSFIEPDGGADGAEVRGNNNLLTGNIVISAGSWAFVVTGSGNAFLGNRAQDLLSARGAFRVEGTENVLDGNVLLPGRDQGARAEVGVSFTQDGNYYGDNRMAAEIPFELNGTTQTDWGGNVGF
jgi:hypothetical protein